MTEAKYVFTIEITSEVIEPFTWGNSFYQIEDDIQGSGYVGGMVHDRYRRVLVSKYEWVLIWVQQMKFELVCTKFELECT